MTHPRDISHCIPPSFFKWPLKWSHKVIKLVQQPQEDWTKVGLLYCLTLLPRPLVPHGFTASFLFLPRAPAFSRPAPHLGGPLDSVITLGNCSAGPTTSKMVGLFSVASVLPSCFPKKPGIWSLRAGAGVPLTSFPLPSLEPWHPALGKKLDRKCHSI